MNCETCRSSGYGWHENECSRPTTECGYQPIEQPIPETKEVKKELNNSNDCISRADVEQTVEDNILCYTHSDRPIDQDPDIECHMAIRMALRMLRKDLRKLPSVQPERKKDTIQKFHDYQVEWLSSHCDLELEPQLEEWVVRFLHDTANRYMMEIDREEGGQNG